MVRNKEPNKKIRSTSGITMIALVITIIVLLILAAVSVATLTGENGILTRAQQAKIETEKAAIEEQIRLAILSAKTKAMGGNITIQDVLEELDKAGVDYEAEEGEDGTSITIDGNYEYEIKEENGEVGEPTYGGTVDKPKPKIAIEETNYEDNTIEVKVSTKRNEQGTLEFYIKEEGQGDYEKKETIENAPEEYTYTFEVADKTKTYRIKVVALAKNGETAQTEVTVVGIPTLSSSNTTFTYTPTTATNKNVTATITVRNINNAENYILQYSIGNPEEESTWKDYTKAITITQNGSVYARLKDKKKGQAGKYTKLGEISNIDRTGPVFDENNKPTATATTNSITITGSATDERGGIVTYQYGIALKKDTEEEMEWTWEPKEKGITETEHTFTNLTQDTDYSLQMIAIDSLGNRTPSEILTISTDPVPGLKEETTDETTGIKTGNTVFAYNPSTWTNGETVGITATIDEQKVDKTKYDTIQYKTEKTGEGKEVADWTTYPTGGISLTRNQKIYLRVIDSTEQYADIYATGNVDKIDRQLPEEFEITAEVTSSIELKDASDEIKQKHQFIRSVSTGRHYGHNYSYTIGDLIYCEDSHNDGFGKGYYRALQTSSNPGYNYAHLTDTNHFEYLGESYLVPSVTIKGSTTDKPTEEYPASGISKYQFGISKDGGETWEWGPKTKDEEGREVIGKPAVGNQESSYTFEELTLGTNYQFKMKAIDNAGNERDSNKQIVIGDKSRANIPNVNHIKQKTYVTWNLNQSGTEYIINDTQTSMPADWYDYENGKWANIKTENNGLVAYWVWIPRYEYKVPEATQTTATQIDVKFISKNQKADTGYTIHPAFTNEGNGGLGELDGIWVAKFEAVSNNPTASNGGGNVTNLKVQVIPNQPSWRSIQTTNIFTVCRNMTNTGEVLAGSTVDSHMMKNTEWGAVVILSQSKYGIFNSQSSIENPTDGNNRRIWNNPSSSYITGSVGSSEDDSDKSSVNAYNSANGPKASTTGTVYGVYDMAGGSWEYVAGCLNGQENAKFGVTAVDSKYVDLYTNSSNDHKNYDGAKIGDATKETKGWIGDFSLFIHLAGPVFLRGRCQHPWHDYELFFFRRRDRRCSQRLRFPCSVSPIVTLFLDT